MIQMNRENIMMIATAVCVVGLLFLFKELNKTREEMTGFKKKNNPSKKSKKI